MKRSTFTSCRLYDHIITAFYEQSVTALKTNGNDFVNRCRWPDSIQSLFGSVQPSPAALIRAAFRYVRVLA